MTDASSPLLTAIRKAAKSGLWSRGVSLARAGAVGLDSRSAEEVELRVKAAGRIVPVTVVLYPQDEEWDCDCGSRMDPCEHVVAAAISLTHDDGATASDHAGGDRTGGDLVPGDRPPGDGAPSDRSPSANANSVDGGVGGGAGVGLNSSARPAAVAPPRLQTAWSRVVYRLERVSGGLRIARGLARSDGSEVALQGSLTSLAAGPERATLVVEQWDLAADRLLDRPLTTALRPERLEALLKLLTGARYVLLDGRPVVIAEEAVLPRGRVEHRRGQWIVTVDRAPEVSEVLAPGALRCGDTIARAGETELTGRRLEKLPLVRELPEARVGELTATVLPELARRIPVDVLSDRLPRIDRELRPYLACDVTRIDQGVSLLPTLVYGVPPQVRIDGGQMVYLRGAVPLRDEDAEQALERRLRANTHLALGKRTTVPVADIPTIAQQLMQVGCRLGGDADRLVRDDLRLVPRLRPTEGEHASATGGGGAGVRLDLAFDVEGGSGEASIDAADVMRAWTDGHGLVALDDGGFVPLPREWLAAHGHLLSDLLAARDAEGVVHASAAPVVAELCEALEHPTPPSLQRLLPLWEDGGGVPDVAPPADLKAQLRPYQRRGLAWLSFLKAAHLGGILADDMGLGKTVQTIAALEGRTLIVAPTSVLPNWRAELERFRPSLRVSLYHGPSRALDDDADVVLTTYAILRLDQQLLGARRWSSAVLDEAQAIKNPQSQVARAAFGLNADFRLALSGTPVENRLEELWSLMHFVNPGLLGGRRDFEEHVARRISDGDAKAAARLRKRVGPFVLRRMKRDVAPELPPRIESVLHVQLDDRERRVYDTVRAATKKELVALVQGGGGGMMKALEALLRLRQAACHSALVPGQEASSSSKVEALTAALTSATDNGHKALVFSQWTSMLDKVEPALKRAGIDFERLDGSTRDRQAVTSRFSAPEGAPVLLMSLKAGGTGLNLTAANHVFLVDPWWNPAVEAQAADRAHRIGQERTVYVSRLISQDTVEEKILALQEEKRALLDAALGDATAASGLAREDLLALLD